MVRGRLLESSFAGALQHAFVQEFPEDAWTLLSCYACNTLHGHSPHLSLGMEPGRKEGRALHTWRCEEHVAPQC